MSKRKSKQIGTMQIAALHKVSRQTATTWCSRGWLKTARRQWVGVWWGWVADVDEVDKFEPPKPGPKPVAELRLGE